MDLPDCSTLELEVEYASDDRTVTLTAGDQQAEVSLSDYIPAQGEFTGIGSAVRSFSLENGQFYASYSLYFTCEDLPPTTVYLADVRAPVLFREGRWQLGRGTSAFKPGILVRRPEGGPLDGRGRRPLVAHSQEELLALFPPPQSDP